MNISSPFWKGVLKNMSFYASVLLVAFLHIVLVYFCLSQAKTLWDTLLSFSPLFSFLGIHFFIGLKARAIALFWPHLFGIGFVSSVPDKNTMDEALLNLLKAMDPDFAQKNPQFFKEGYVLSSLDHCRIEKRLNKKDRLHEKTKATGTFLDGVLLGPEYPSNEDKARRNDLFFQEGPLASAIKSLREKDNMIKAVGDLGRPKKTRKM